jgi:hypothetical protein
MMVFNSRLINMEVCPSENLIGMFSELHAHNIREACGTNRRTHALIEFRPSV